jgi:hypothetical protein
VGGPGCDFGETQGFKCKSAWLRLWGWIWATGSKSSGQDLMQVGVLGLTVHLTGWPGVEVDLSRRSRDAKEKMALGFTNRDGDDTGTLSGERRAPRWPPEAARATRRGGRRGGAAAELRRGRLVDGVRGQPNKQHQGVPYHAADLRSSAKRPDGGKTTTDRTAARRAHDGGARVRWRWLGARDWAARGPTAP